MKKIGIIIHQYGDDIVGGAESYSKDLAEHLSRDYDVTVFTTTSIDYNTWAPFYKAGEEIINGVHVKRYDVGHERNMQKFSGICNRLVGKLQCGETTTKAEDEEWICEEGPFCPDMIEDIKKSKDEYVLFIVVTYIYYLAVKALPEVAEKALFISTAHDEPWINMSMYKELFHLPRYFGFLTDAEKELVRQKFNNAYIPHKVLGTGIQVPKEINSNRAKDKFQLGNNYIVYVGRLDETKGCLELCNYFLEYKKRSTKNLKLVLVGKGDMDVPEDDSIIATGFVTDEEKYDIISGAFAMVTPSKYESLCIALLEGMALGIPVIANEKCMVLKQHCIKSNAGLFYDNCDDFCKILDYLYSHSDEYAVMQKNGKEYVENNYTWDIVQKKITEIVGDISSTFRDAVDVDKHKVILDKDVCVEPVFDKDAIVVVTAADNSYANYAGITINSIVQNMSIKDNYDILVFTNNMSDDKINQICSMTEMYANVSVRFVYVDGVMNSLNINVSNNYKIVTYYRLLLQKTMSRYDKVIYMDSDIIINYDLKDLWSIQMETNLIAGTYDSLVAAWQNYDSGMQAYFKAIGVCAPGKYIQAGIILLNIRELNATYDQMYLLEKACEEHYIFADQDLLNIACKDRIQYIDQAWDVLNLSDEGRALTLKYLPKKLQAEFIKAEEAPKAIHYVEQSFPFKKEMRKFSRIYWEYTYGTPFYMELKNLYLKSEKGKNKVAEKTKNVGLWRRIIRYLSRNGVITTKEPLTIYDNVKINDAPVDNKGQLKLKYMDILSGPGIMLGAGNHKVEVVFENGYSKNVKVTVTAGARHIVLCEKVISDKCNEIPFKTNCNQIDVEVIIQNDKKEDLIINGIRLI